MTESMAGKATWFDLLAPDPVDAMAFYEGLFQWEFKRMDASPIENYWVIQSGRDMIGGLRQGATGGPGPVIYFTVENLESATRRAKELGATLVGERVDLGNRRGCYQWFRDRQNNVVAFWAPS